jgi:hypothetical protein
MYYDKLTGDFLRCSTFKISSRHFLSSRSGYSSVTIIISSAHIGTFDIEHFRPAASIACFQKSSLLPNTRSVALMMTAATFCGLGS